MPCVHDTHMLNPSLVNSLVPNHVTSLLLTPLDPLVHANARDTHHTGHPVRAQTRPGHARTRPGMTLDAPERQLASPRQRSTRPLLAPLAPLRHQPPPGHAHWLARRSYTTTPSSTSAAVLRGSVTLASSSLPCFPRNQALPHLCDVAKPPASAPVPQSPCRCVVDDDLTAAPQTPLDAIKGGPPAPIQAHHRLPLSSQPLLATSLLHIAQ
jgi:hypothetical protein